MRFFRPFLANAGLLMLLCHVPCVVPEQCPVRRAHAKRLELCHFVLMRDCQWWPVLSQPVKLTANSRAPYDTDASVDADVRARLRVAADDAVTVTPMDVLQTVTNELSWLGSYVNYAVLVLRKAFTCVVFAHLSRTIELIEKLDTETGTLKPAAEGAESSGSSDDRRDVAPLRASYLDAWLTVAMLTNKLAVVDGDLEIMRNLLNVLSYALVEKEQVSYTVIKLLHRRVDKKIDGTCERHELAQAYLDSGSPEENSAKMSIGQFSRNLFEFYGSLEVEMIEMETWSQVINYKLPNAKHIRLVTVIDDLMKNDKLQNSYEKLRQKLEINLLEYVADKILQDGNGLGDNNDDEDDILRFDDP